MARRRPAHRPRIRALLRPPWRACSYFTPARHLYRDEGRVTIDPRAEFYFTDAITDEAVDYLANHFESRAEGPFFLYVAYTAPHWPMHAHEEDIARYRGVYEEGWHAIREERLERLVEMGIVSHDWQLPEMEPSKPWRSVQHRAWEQRRMEVYAAMVDRMDQGIGRIVDLIREQKALENTVVVFLSDNGGSQEEVQANTSYVVTVLPDAFLDLFEVTDDCLAFLYVLLGKLREHRASGLESILVGFS